MCQMTELKLYHFRIEINQTHFSEDVLRRDLHCFGIISNHYGIKLLNYGGFPYDEQSAVDKSCLIPPR